jgi:quinol monooxygenase YgiN
MVTRIVKMTFRIEACEDFLSIFNKYKEKIRNAEGCVHLQLLRETKDGNIFFTYSKWEDEKYLDIYRNSPIFAEVWPQTKALFTQPAEAWTVDELMTVEGRGYNEI